MLSSLARSSLSTARRSPLALTCHRHAMMSALPGPHSHTPSIPDTRQHRSPQRTPLLKDAPPVVVPTGEAVSVDVTSPQIAARPPPVPKAPRPRPTIRSTKAALCIVRLYFRVSLNYDMHRADREYVWLG